MQRLKFRNAIMCEYATEGVGNKKVLINVYGGDVLVSEFPAVLPVAFYAEVLPDADMAGDVVFEVLLNGKVISSLNGRLRAAAGEPAMLVVPQMAIPLKGEARIKLVGKCEGRTKTTLVNKRVYLEEDFNRRTNA